MWTYNYPNEFYHNSVLGMDGDHRKNRHNEHMRNTKRVFNDEKKQSKQDVKTSNDEFKYDIDSRENGQVEFKNQTIGKIKAAEYTKKVGDTAMNKIKRNTTVKQLAGTTAVVSGASIVNRYLMHK